MAPYITFHGLSNGVNNTGLKDIRSRVTRGIGTKLGKFSTKMAEKSNFTQ